MSGNGILTSDSVVVVKCGGNERVAVESVCADVAELAARGHRLVVVHGGSSDIDRLATRLGVPQRRLVSPDGVSTRYTDAATLEVVTLALAGAVKPRVVAALVGRGVSAIGMTGMDGGLIRARRTAILRAVEDDRQLVVRDSYSGSITGVDGGLLRRLLGCGLVPVVSPPALAEDAMPVNVDADRAAAAIAGAVGASTLVLLTAADGVLASRSDETSTIARLRLPAEGPPPRFAGDGMAMKLIAAREALEEGVANVIIADARDSDPLTQALAGAGTRVELERRAESSAGVLTR